MPRPTIVLSSRELFPFDPGFAGAHVALTARALAPVAEVTVFTASTHEATYHELRARRDPRVDYGGAAVAFVAVPSAEDRGSFHSDAHVYSHRVVERLRQRFAPVGPDLVVFSGVDGEGFVATQARRGGDPLFADTVLAVRLQTSGELRDVHNGYLDPSFPSRVTREIERQTLCDADALLQAGGDLLAAYERFYGTGLAPACRVRHPFESGGPPRTRPSVEGPLRMLHVGSYERRNDAGDLVHALTGLSGDWQLTLSGEDTPTAPLGHSMRASLELQAAEDPRIAFTGPCPAAELRGLVEEHDVVVVPARWDGWPHVVQVALDAGVPVVARRGGGCGELVVPGLSGWLVDGTGWEGLLEVLEPLVADPSRAREATDPAVMHDRIARLTDPDAFRSGHLALVAQHHRPAPPRAAPPLVSVVIPYYAMARFVEETVASVFAQTHRPLEVLLVDDGSLEPADTFLLELAARYPLQLLFRPNGGLGAARNLGIAQSRGTYVLPLDPDDVLEPSFVERCVALLEDDEDVAFVSSWCRYIDERGVPLPAPNEGYRPLGNRTPLVEEQGLAAASIAVVRRCVFDSHPYSEDLTSFEDWALYRSMHRAGRYGKIIPEMLWRYRIRPDSMLREVGVPHELRIREEMDALMIEEEMTWVSTSG